MAKKKEEVKEEVVDVTPTSEPTEKENLLALYQTLKDLGVRSISDLENLIAKS